MAKTWVLDTGTKGTGASVVPLEDRGAEPSPNGELPYVAPERPPKAAKPPEPRTPRRFRVVDVVRGDVLAEHADARATVDVLREVRSVVDVAISVWQPDAESWRLLTLGEQRALWALRARVAGEPSP